MVKNKSPSLASTAAVGEDTGDADAVAQPSRAKMHATKKGSKSTKVTSGRVQGRRSKNEKDVSSSDDDEKGSIDIGACCLCHCSLDYSDRAAFFKEDRHEDYVDGDEDDSYFFRRNDPYLPAELYDKANALVYCDDCDRMYHQQCHFVPLFAVPRGKWSCLLCASMTQMKQQLAPPSSSSSSGKNTEPQQQPLSKKQLAKAKSKAAKETASDGTQQQQKQQQQQQQERKEWLQIAPHADKMFRSPPQPAARPWEQKWEYAVRHLKANLWKTELTQRLKQAVASQASTYRMAETAIIALTSTQKNRSHFSKGASQELAQTLVKLYGARLNWRELCFNVDSIRRATAERWHALHEFVQQCRPNNQEFIERVLFPFGTQHTRRVEPRTSEMKKALLEQNKSHAIPQEIFVLGNDNVANKKETATACKKHHLQHPRKLNSPKRGSKKKADGDEDEQSGISLDNLQCCICHTSTASDENDLIMCDSSGCYRAYHYQCLQPPLTSRCISEESDWFCPICKALAQTMLAIQVEYMGDEWEEARHEAQMDGKPCDDSYKSWDRPDEVFETVEQDYAAALQMKQGKRNKQTDDLLARVLGLDQLSDHDSDDEQEDEHWDLDSFEERRKKEYAKRDGDDASDEDGSDGDDDDSTHSSQATLVNMDDVELKIPKGELDALSKASSDPDDDVSSAPVRRSRRLRQDKGQSRTSANKNAVQDLGNFDKANILEGKRGRKPVDYISLNEAIFGDATEAERINLDDTDDFEAVKRKRKQHDDDNDNASDNSESGESQDGNDSQEQEVEKEKNDTSNNESPAESDQHENKKTTESMIRSAESKKKGKSPDKSGAKKQSVDKKRQTKKHAAAEQQKARSKNGVSTGGDSNMANDMPDSKRKRKVPSGKMKMEANGKKQKTRTAADT